MTQLVMINYGLYIQISHPPHCASFI